MGWVRATMDLDAALQRLTALGASPHLVQHHAMVGQAAVAIVDGLRRFDVHFSRHDVIIGAALHDVGKIVHPAEMHGPGHEHEAAGAALLAANGLARWARFAITHAEWDAPALALDDLLVALADKLWKGKRVAQLEQRVARRFATATHRELWEVFSELDTLFESVAADGPRRVAASVPVR